MKDLIQKLEKATEGSRKLDVAIWNALYPRATTPELPKGHFPVTTSLDAALTLVPEGWRLSLGQDGWGWTATIRSTDARYERVVGQGGYEDILAAGQDASGIQRPTAALALCIAALRARQNPGSEP